MKLDREGRRTAAQFLNGVAIAIIASMVLAPLAAGGANVIAASIAIGCAGALHGLALVIAASR